MTKLNLSNIFLFLVVGLLSLQTVNYYNEKAEETKRFNQTQACYKSQLSRIDALILDTSDEIDSMNENYDKDVYNSKEVDTVLQQQLISSAYSVVAIEKLYLHNIKLLDILAHISVCGGYK